MNQLAGEKLLSQKFLLLLAAAFGVFLGNGIVTPVLPVFVKDGLGGGDVAVGASNFRYRYSALDHAKIQHMGCETNPDRRDHRGRNLIGF